MATTICYLPGREASYSRTRVLLNGMKAAGLHVLDCSSEKKSFLRYLVSFFKFLKYKSKCDVIFVGFLGQFLVPLVKLFTRKKIIFDAFVSVYQTMVFDRKKFRPNGLFSKLSRFIDEYSCRCADVVFLDTQQHIDFFASEYSLPREKLNKLLVGSDDTIMFPQDLPANEPFTVHFHGEFQALHGIEYIIRAAKLLPEIQFQIMGRGRMLNACLKEAEDASNIRFLPPCGYEQLPKYIARADISLGIFGATQKAQRVIPHKVYEAMACRKAIITADSPAAEELLVDGEHALFCKPADHQGLADAIKKLKSDPALRNQIAENAYNLFTEKCVPRVLGEKIKILTEELLATQQ